MTEPSILDPDTWHGARSGAHVPGVLVAGTFHHDGERVFWDVNHPERSIAIRLRDERYSRLVIEVEDSEATASELETAVKRRPE